MGHYVRYVAKLVKRILFSASVQRKRHIVDSQEWTVEEVKVSKYYESRLKSLAVDKMCCLPTSGIFIDGFNCAT